MRTWIKASALSAFIIVMFFGTIAAYAQTTTGDGVNFAPAVNNIITIVGGVLGTALTFLVGIGIRLGFAKVGLTDVQTQQLMADKINDAILKGIDYAEAWMKQEVASSSQINNVQFDNFFLKQAVQYVLTRVPDALSYMKIDEAHLSAMIMARINAFLKVPVAGSGVVEMTTSVPATPVTVTVQPTVDPAPQG
jgi:hypothetical protein